MKPASSRSSSKQRQHRPKTRAPHGSPKYTHQVGLWVTRALFEKFHSRGGSAWARRALKDAP